MNNTTISFTTEEFSTIQQLLMFVQMDETPLDEVTLESLNEKFEVSN
jgi:hypothetical protein